MIIYLGRHPETIANEKKLIYGKTHYPYTELGRHQFKGLVQTCASLEIEKIYASPLLRVKTLAQAIGDMKGLAVHYDHRLEEMNFGLFEGLSVEAAERTYPNLYKQYLTEFNSFTIPKGEAYNAFVSRIHCFIDGLLHEEIKAVLLITHGGVIKEMLEKLLGLSVGQGWLFQVRPGRLVEVRVMNGSGQLII